MIPFVVLVLLSELFSVEIPGEGSTRVVACLENGSGSFAVLEEREGFGGYSRTRCVYLDHLGTQIESWFLPGFLRPLCAVSFSGGHAVVCIEEDSSETELYHVTEGGTTVPEIILQGQFSGGVSAECGYGTLILVGNDTPGDSPVRLVLMDEEMNMVSNSVFPEVEMTVADVEFSQSGYPLVLGSTVQSGGTRDIAILDTETGTVHHIMPVPGRYEPVDLQCIDDGYMVTANAVTAENSMIGQVLVQRLDTDLSQLSRSFTAGSSWITAVASVATGEGIAVTGWTNDLPLSETNRSDLFIHEYSMDASLLWTREYGGGTPDYGLNINQKGDGGFLVSGCFTEGMYSGWVLSTDSTGGVQPQGIDPGNTRMFLSVGTNPSSNGSIAISLPVVCTDEHQVLVMDVMGRVVRRGTTISGDVVFRGLTSGVYLVTVETPAGLLCARAVVTGGAL